MSKKKTGARHSRPSAPATPVIPVNAAELMAIVERARSALSSQEHDTLKAAMHTLTFLTEELQRKQASLRRLRGMLFGASTETTRAVLGAAASTPQTDAPDPDPAPGAAQPPPAAPPSPAAAAKPKRPGHGRRPAAAYAGAEQVVVPHPELRSGAQCPCGCGGRVYAAAEPSPLVRITGMAPLSATVYSCERLRCNLCGELFTAPPPAGVGTHKYDESATAMVGLLKYGAGLPFNRIEKLQSGMRIPLPAATQWELVEEGADDLVPPHQELIRQGAQAKVVHNDDTTMRVLELTRAQRAAAAADEQTDARTGIFTSGIVATGDGHRIALFFTGVKHAGENLADVLRRRAAELPPPIQMCDALACNTAGDFDTILANCLTHARRRYVEVAESFPAECARVLQTLRQVYVHDAHTRQKALDDPARLAYHQEHSAPPMAGLEAWMTTQFDERRVEPNSGLGQAIRYMQNHWKELTVFLRVPGAPLDNNLCERVLKKAILHRKTAMFYKTANGARVGDLYMSLIHTAELNHVAPFEYLVALLRHAPQVAAAPQSWMPWNYQATLAGLASGTSPPP
jgi:transposase